MLSARLSLSEWTYAASIFKAARDVGDMQADLFELQPDADAVLAAQFTYSGSANHFLDERSHRAGGCLLAIGKIGDIDHRFADLRDARDKLLIGTARCIDFRGRTLRPYCLSLHRFRQIGRRRIDFLHPSLDFDRCVA